MRAMRKKKLTFGPLLNVQVKMYKATDDGRAGELEFHQHHGPECLGRIRMLRTCEECKAMVDYKDIVKGTEFDGQLVIVTEDEFASVEEDVSPHIEIEQFCQADEVDPIMFEGTYYLEPDGSAEEYALLRQTLIDTDRVGIVKFAITNKAKMGVLRVIGNVMVIHTLLWLDQIRSAQTLVGLDAPVDTRAAELATVLVDSMTSEFDPSKFSDGYSERLIDMVTAKAADPDAVVARKPVDLDNAPNVGGLMAMLEASVAGLKKPAKAPAKKATPRKKRGAA